MALTEDENLAGVIEEFCNDHAISKGEDNADYELDASTFHNWCDATGNEAYKDAVPDNKTLRERIAGSAFAEMSEVPE